MRRQDFPRRCELGRRRGIGKNSGETVLPKRQVEEKKSGGEKTGKMEVEEKKDVDTTWNSFVLRQIFFGGSKPSKVGSHRKRFQCRYAFRGGRAKQKIEGGGTMKKQ